MSMLIRLKGLVANTTITEPPYVAPVSDEWMGEFSPISWSIKRQQDNTGSWNFAVPATLRFADELKNYSRAYFYLDGEEIMHGLVDDLQIDMAGDKVIFNVSGLGEVAELDRVLSANLTHYQDTEIIAIMQELLRFAGWRLGDFSTMPNVLVRTTIDLREQETVLQQVQRVCECSPGIHWRWGGYNCQGYPMLDIGYFDELQPVYLTQTEQPFSIDLTAAKFGARLTNTTVELENQGFITSAQISQTYTNLISEVHGNGGTYNLTTDPDKQRVMNLWHVNELLTAFPAYVDPDYPIVLDANNFHRIRNVNLYPDGASIRKAWDFMVTKNEDPPTYSELVTAAFGLYKKCIRFLQEHAHASDTYTLGVIGLRTAPPPGDRIQVNASYLDRALPNGESIQFDGETLDGDYRLVSWSMDGNEDKVTYSFSLTEYEFIGDVDPDQDVVILSEQRESFAIKGRASGVICADYAITVEQDDVTDVKGTGDPADCMICETEDDAITVTVAFGVPTTGLKYVKVIGVVPTPTIPFDWDLVQAPTLTAELPDDPAILCFRFRRDVWDVTDAVSLKTHLRFWG